MIKAFSKLNSKIVEEIREVEAMCKKHDTLYGRLVLNPSSNFNPEMKSLFLLYEDDKLVSFLSMFIPSRDEAEISAYTLAEHRRKGFFTRLYNDALKELRKYGIPSMLFVCEPQSTDGRGVINRLKARLEFTEHLLRYQNRYNMLQPTSGLELLKVRQNDLETMAKLCQVVFNDDYDNAISFTTRCFESEHRVQYIAKLGEIPVGMGSVYLEDGETQIYGLGVVPAYQGKGYGTEILNLLIREIQKSGIEEIVIEVESTNQPALHLYKKCGFEMEASFNYYRKSVPSIA